MEKELYRRALEYHGGTRPGKIAVVPTKPHATQHDLALAYSPGVAAPCLEIARDPASSYDYTGRGNLVAVVTDGSAVLGLGDIGPEAAKPVMEGKCMLFKLMAGIDAFDLELDARDPEAFVETVCRLAPTFGAVNLEDIKAPECFEIERRLNAKLPIPVMHDDQHGTAVIVAAAVINALHLNGKRIETLRTVVSGAGAAAIASVRLLLALGIRREHLVLCDSRGVISVRRTDLNDVKREFATHEPYDTLGEAIVGADLFLGVSRGGVLTPDMLRTMAPAPIVLALANPVPEIPYAEAVAARPDALVATGRSNDPNQVNNALCFPFLFRGAKRIFPYALLSAAVSTAGNMRWRGGYLPLRNSWAGRPLPAVITPHGNIRRTPRCRSLWQLFTGICLGKNRRSRQSMPVWNAGFFPGSWKAWTAYPLGLIILTSIRPRSI